MAKHRSVAAVEGLIALTEEVLGVIQREWPEVDEAEDYLIDAITSLNDARDLLHKQFPDKRGDRVAPRYPTE